MRQACLNSLLFLLFFTTTSVFGQSVRSHEKGGRPFGLQLYAEDELPNLGQNWSLTQDNRGVMYVANHAGVLEHDGNEWRLIKLADDNIAFSIAVNDAGIVHVGSRNDFGYLAPDSTGTLAYRSLREHVEEEDLGFGIIWTTTIAREGVYFQANSHLFLWDGQTIKSWRSPERMHTSFVVNDRFYLKRDGTGLLYMKDGDLQLIPGGERFADQRVFFMTEADDHVLIAAQEGMDGPLEIFEFDGTMLNPVGVDKHLINEDYTYTFYNGSKLSNGKLALGTLYDGVFIIGQDGALIETLDADRGVAEDVNSTYVDFQGGLWIAHNVSGISYIAAPMGLSQYGSIDGLFGATNSVLRHDNSLYVATDNGLFRLKDRLSTSQEDEPVQFDRVSLDDNEEAITWSMLSMGDELLLAAEHGVLSLKNNKSELVAFGDSDVPGKLFESRHFEDRVYVGLESGWGMLTKTRSGSWQGQQLGEIRKKVTSFFEAEDGTLWLNTTAPGKVWRVRFDADGEVSEEIKVVSSDDLGTPYMKVANIGGEIAIIALPQGVFRPQDSTLKPGIDLVKDERFFQRDGVEIDIENDVLDLVAVGPNQYWTVYKDRVEATSIINGIHNSTTLPAELMLPEWGKFRKVYLEPEGTAWISNTKFRPLVRYNFDVAENPQIQFSQEPLLRGLRILGADSVLYGGSFSALAAAEKFKKSKILSVDLRHLDNDLQFDFVLPHYNKQSQVEYRYYLKGHDERWSKWTKDTYAIYRNIDPGNLTFNLQARVGEAIIGNTSTVSLTIRAPWFWSWWMQLFYVLFIGYSIFQYVRFQRAKKQLVLLNIERELNARLQLANQQLRSANDSLEQANRLKDEFLANASHELRTPLTAILGFTSVLKEEVPDENLEFLGLIDENGKRLLQTINSLLDLAKLRAGMLELNFQSLDIGSKTEEVVDLLKQLARNQKLTLDIKRPEDLIKVRLDAHCYERILYNLIGNAIKFTDVGGVSVEIERSDEEVLVHIIDTGVGIDENFIPQLFDEFKQEPNNQGRTEGSGLGLTITAQLVELLNGTISVKSQKGQGSVFTVAFQVDEIEVVDKNGDSSFHVEPSPHTALR